MTAPKSENDYLVAVLRRVAVSPGLYLGREDVRALELYVAGYRHAWADLGNPVERTTVLDEFYRWLSKRMRQTTTLGWWGLIEARDASDTNVRTFFTLFDEFLTAGGSEGPPSPPR
jgi:hypothetical protein